MSDLPFTGERFIPGVKGEIWMEHWHRYHFAARWAAGRRVLDVACGEGYGSALLARGAAHVTGVDVSEAAIAHARAAYAGTPNLEFARASCTRLPLADASVDLAVSFETVEHIHEQEAFLDELARVVSPGGVLVISCPNRLEYCDKRGFVNEFHVKELYREELARLVQSRFPHAQWYGQRPTFFSVIAPEGGAAAAQLVQVTESQPSEGGARLENPLYFLVAASRDPATLANPVPALSVLSDRDDWVYRDYEKVMRELTACLPRAERAEAAAADAGRRAEELASQVAQLRTAVRLQENALLAQDALAQAQEALHKAALAEKDHEIGRRRGLRWWLKLPLVRLGLLKE